MSDLGAEIPGPRVGGYVDGKQHPYGSPPAYPPPASTEQPAAEQGGRRSTLAQFENSHNVQGVQPGQFEPGGLEGGRRRLGTDDGGQPARRGPVTTFEAAPGGAGLGVLEPEQATGQHLAALMAEAEPKAGRRHAPEPPVPGRGVTRIADEVVEKVAAIAAREVEGVHDLGGDVSRMFQVLRERAGLAGADAPATPRGVSVQVTGHRADVRLTLVVQYGYVVLSVCDAVRANVIDTIERMLGLDVTEVNIVVDDIRMPEDK
ncbi:Asp23/Gls24 family envelope stress response protein [Longispora albida]|uniref:Asp23/Gls24 family envelope stress response protein n=1 Tax=Longispora albida TaxID=203523 RepID=UPI0003736E0B|nr:Asp23/Gls24 family envelope stress response protein [Longispora albida]